jgi:DNA-binding transcriptional LysR family regulator
MEWRLLRSFLVVAEELHFGRAARRLGISQPPLSGQIRKLEGELGAQLFLRDRRSVELTEAGEALLPRARHLVADMQRARVEVQRTAAGESGALALGYTPTATYEVLPAVLPLFRQRRPDVLFELTEMRSAQVPGALRSGRVEIGIVCAPVDAQGLEERALVREGLLVALPRLHPLARKSSVSVKELSGQPVVLVSRDIEPGWADASVRALEAAGVQPRVVQETDSKIGLLGLVAAGLGLALVSESMATWRRTGVRYRPLRGLPLRLTLSVLSTTCPSPRAQAFLETLAEAVDQRGPGRVMSGGRP